MVITRTPFRVSFFGGESNCSGVVLAEEAAA